MNFLPALVIAGFALVLPAAAQAALPTAKDFARLPNIDLLAISPDGEHLAVATRNQEGQSLLAILALPGRKPVYATRMDGDDAVGDVTWASNTRLVLSLARRESADDLPALTGELLGFNLDGSRREYLFGYRMDSRRSSRGAGSQGIAYVAQPLYQDPEHVLVMAGANTVDSVMGEVYQLQRTPLYRMNVFDGRLSKVADAPTRYPQHYLVNEQGQPRFAEGFNEVAGVTAIHYWAGEKGWQPMALGGLRRAALTAQVKKDAAYFEVEHEGLKHCLVEARWQADAPPLIREVLCKSLQQAHDFHFNANGQPIGFSNNENGSVEFFDAKEPVSAVMASLQEQFPGYSVRLQDASRDGGRLIFRVAGDRLAPQFYLYDRKSGAASFLDEMTPWFDPEQQGRLEMHQYKSRDGLSIQAYLTLPVGSSGKSMPLVVMPHGGPIGVRDRAEWDADVQYLASRGYAVLRMNFRGSSGYGRAFEDKGYGAWATGMIDDIVDGTRWAIDKGYADAGRVCIFGASYGGYAALMAAARAPELYRCAIGYAGVYDLNRLMKNSDAAQSGSGRAYFSQATASTPEARAVQSPISHAGKIKAAVMLIHGESDIRTPFDQAKAMKAALEAVGRPPEWLVKYKAGHGFTSEADRLELYERLAAFLDRQLARK